MKATKGHVPSNLLQTRHQQSLLGIPVDAVSFGEAKERVLDWGQQRSSRYVVFANAHVLVTASQEHDFRLAVVSADLVNPDGAPVAWMLRKLGFAKQRRVSGPDFMWALLGRCERQSLPVYFYGSTPETLARLQSHILAVFPHLHIVGLDSPPFRTLSDQEDADTVKRINASGAGLVFVGLGCPKQELWMYKHQGHVNAVMLGVGAAFDFHAGTLARAPQWMRKRGLEWLHRLAMEPKRLWRRYLVTNTLFVLGAIRQLLRGGGEE